VTLFDAPAERPPSKLRRYAIVVLAVIITIGAFVAAFPSYFWYPFAYHTEISTVSRFMDTVVAGKMQEAYQIWKPAGSYSSKDFLDDWGPDGYYGPVRSYRLGRPEHIKNGSAAAIIIEVSAYQPYPKDDPVKMNRSKTVTLWVDFKDQSISFPPN
jgi:hypothetical protein